MAYQPKHSVIDTALAIVNEGELYTNLLKHATNGNNIELNKMIRAYYDLTWIRTYIYSYYEEQNTENINLMRSVMWY